MVTRIGGKRRKSRYTMTKEPRAHGKFSITRFFQKFNTGDKVVLKIDPIFQKGDFVPRRFEGKVGNITGMQGKCYRIEIADMNKDKILIIHPMHLKRISEIK